MKKRASISYERYIERLKAAGFDFESKTEEIHKDADKAISAELNQSNHIFDDLTKIQQKKVGDPDGTQ